MALYEHAGHRVEITTVGNSRYQPVATVVRCLDCGCDAFTHRPIANRVLRSVRDKSYDHLYLIDPYNTVLHGGWKVHERPDGRFGTDFNPDFALEFVMYAPPASGGYDAVLHAAADIMRRMDEQPELPLT